MIQLSTPFHDYIQTRTLASSGLAGAYVSANIKILPYQVAAAEFAMRASSGVVLADEGSLGKTYEALLVASQMWIEGRTRQLLVVPANLVEQWVRKIEGGFSLPFAVWDGGALPEDTLVVTTYERAAAMPERQWDLVIFDEADVLSKPENQLTKALKKMGNFKLLLTPTPITKDILDIHGLLHFIDETILPDAQQFYKRYFRHPENYAELGEMVAPHVFRTLKSQVAEYVNFTKRVPFTPQIELTTPERELYKLVEKFIEIPHKKSYPEMGQWELSLMLFHSLSSSPQAFCKTIEGATQRAEGAEKELLQQAKSLAESISVTAKMRALLDVIEAAKQDKVLIFTDNLTTQAVLKKLLKNVVNTVDEFRKARRAVLVATDSVAKGLDMEFCSMVVNYDLLWNAIEMEQRIARCHRQGQTRDVLVVSLLQPENLADVRILELINKRVAQFDGIFGMSDPIVGNFHAKLDELNLRSAHEIEQAFAENLASNKPANQVITRRAEDTLFTTFTREIAEKVAITPEYVEDFEARLWTAVRAFFSQREDYEIDDENKTLTLKTDTQPVLFYVDGRAYRGLKKFSKISPISPLIRGILNETECADAGTITVAAPIEPCEIGFYTVGFPEKNATFEVLCGRTKQRTLSDKECREILQLPVKGFTEDGARRAYWLRHATIQPPHPLDALVGVPELERKRRQVARERKLSNLHTDIKVAEKRRDEMHDRREALLADKVVKLLQRDLRLLQAAAPEDKMKITRHFAVKIYGQN